MVVPDDKTRKTFTLSKTVVKALALRVAQEIQEGKRTSVYKAESEIVEEALRQYLGVKEDSDAGNGS